jgi:hypothetical protein
VRIHHREHRAHREKTLRNAENYVVQMPVSSNVRIHHTEHRAHREKTLRNAETSVV